MTFEQAAALFVERVNNNVNLKPRTHDYCAEIHAALLKSWPTLGEPKCGKRLARSLGHSLPKCAGHTVAIRGTARISRKHGHAPASASVAGAPQWRDLDFEAGEIVVRGDPVSGTMNWWVQVQIIPPTEPLFRAMRDRRPDEPKDAQVFLIRDCENSMTRAKKVPGEEIRPRKRGSQIP